ncbi:hypothetical protein AeNC1_011796 [Aphanomyces euteiches]|nr:hypothetical protein AeNC1_011796 [Aphanomyces euteiches]
MEIARGFEERGGIPNVVGVIDGCLVMVKRFKDPEGWYCRTGFPAFNMQGVVDDRLRFMSYSIRSGSQNDKFLFNRSQFGLKAHKIIPTGTFFLADAGYKLYQHIMTPYEIRSTMTSKESHYNDVHSRTRSTVEQAFGRWKNKFRIFKKPLDHHTPEEMARLIEATIVLHNWFIDYDALLGLVPDIEDDNIELQDWMHIGGDITPEHTRNLVDGDEAKISRDTLSDYIYKFVE